MSPSSSTRAAVDSPAPDRPDPQRLRAVTRALGDDERFDPVSVGAATGVLFTGGGVTLAGRGVAAVLALPGGLASAASVDGVVDWLASVPSDDPLGRPGTGVVAHGALPFDPTADGRLLVPAVTFGDDGGGNRWVTVVSGDDESPPDWRAAMDGAGPEVDAGRPTLRARPSPAGYMAAVAAAVEAIVAGRLAKVVMARSLDARFPTAPDPEAVVRRLLAQEPACTVFSHPLAEGRFLGASPELLVSRRGRAVTSSPVAGTIGLDADAPDGDRATERLLGSGKDRVEHQLVVDEIATALIRRGADLEVPDEPTLMRLHSVAHLLTPISGRFDDPARPVPDVLSLLADLHPTPAVGGVPRAVALELIARLETTPRGQWAGPVGWIGGTGDGDWVIGIRSVTLDGPRARLVAGAGIVAASEPAAELAETTLKLVPVMEALAPGSSTLLSG